MHIEVRLPGFENAPPASIMGISKLFVTIFQMFSRPNKSRSKPISSWPHGNRFAKPTASPVLIFTALVKG